jgi:hypothetical protein
MTQERRGAARIDKLFRVRISTEDAGDQWCLARNISATGMFVEMADPLPLRTKVIVRFQLPGDDAAILAVALVQNHYYLQYGTEDGLRALSGVGLRLIRFESGVAAPVPRDRLH